MNNIWSEKIQGTKTLYLSRKLRFDERYAARYKELFKIKPVKGGKLLEIGCDPGALAGALHRWYPELQITAIDRDTNFIRFAKENEPGIEFIEADAAALPFADGSFDFTISYTVCEHVNPSDFWGEQYRALRSGGVCICLSVRPEKGKTVKAPCLYETEEERLFWSEVTEDNDDFEKYGVGRYFLSEEELCAAPSLYGFSDISSGHVTVELAPDDLKFTRDFARRIIEAGRQSDIEAVLSTGSEKAAEIVKIINEKYDERIRLLNEGVPQGDTAKTVVMAVIAVKR